jgi:hypothetical protein
LSARRGGGAFEGICKDGTLQTPGTQEGRLALPGVDGSIRAHYCVRGRGACPRRVLRRTWLLVMQHACHHWLAASSASNQRIGVAP